MAISFGEVLEAADQLTLSEKEELIDVLNRRIIELRRKELSQEIADADREYQEGRAQVVTPEILSSYLY